MVESWFSTWDMWDTFSFVNYGMIYCYTITKQFNNIQNENQDLFSIHSTVIKTFSNQAFEAQFI